MSHRLLKFAKRKAAWIDAAQQKLSIDELQKVEFKHRDGGPDFTPSVYAVEPEHPRAVQAYAEHAAGVPIDPPKSTIGLDAIGLCSALRETPGNPRFQFICQRHRELIIHGIVELHELIRNLLHEFEERHEPLIRDEVIDYAKARIRDGDREWIDFTQSPGANEKGWLKLLSEKKRT